MASKRMTVNAPNAEQAGGVMRRELNRRGIITGPLTVREAAEQRDDDHVALAVLNAGAQHTFEVVFDVVEEA